MVVTNDGKRIYYLSGGALMTAALTDAKTAETPAAVSVTGVQTIHGMAFAADGTLYVAGVDNTSTQIFKMQIDSATAISMVEAQLPSGLCPITDLSFVDGDVTKELYVAYPLAGCHMPDGKGSYIAQGVLGKNMGAFIAALTSWGYRAPHVVTGGLTLLLSSVGTSARLYYAERPSLDSLWTGPLDLPLAGIGGAGKRDAHAVISSNCNTLYISSERAGGKGGLDLWAADISPP
jgi:hypothetical protein